LNDAPFSAGRSTVELEIKETDNEGGRLYLAIVLDNKKTKVTDTAVPNMDSPVTTLIDYKIADLIKNVNPTAIKLNNTPFPAGRSTTTFSTYLLTQH